MRGNTKRRIAVALCAALVAASAWALKSDKQQPINIQADHGEFQNDSANNATSIYTGHVVITQGSIRITADKAVLHTLNGELQTADMTGAPATFQQQPDSGALMHGTAAEIIYTAATDQVDLLGNAELVQGQRQLSAAVIHYNTATEHVLAVGGQNNGRVHITLPPKQPPAGGPP